LRSADLDPSATAFREPLFEHISILEVDRHMNLYRNKRRIDVVLLKHRLEKLTRIKIELVLPEKFAFIDHTAAPHVKNGNGDHVLLLMESEDVDIVVAHHGHFLPFRKRFHRVDRIPIMRGKFVLLGGRSFFHLHLQPLDQVVVSAFEKKLHVLDGFLVLLEGC
jgi:hypothetical protein